MITNQSAHLRLTTRTQIFDVPRGYDPQAAEKELFALTDPPPENRSIKGRLTDHPGRMKSFRPPESRPPANVHKEFFCQFQSAANYPPEAEVFQFLSMWHWHPANDPIKS